MRAEASLDELACVRIATACRKVRCVGPVGSRPRELQTENDHVETNGCPAARGG